MSALRCGTHIGMATAMTGDIEPGPTLAALVRSTWIQLAAFGAFQVRFLGGSFFLELFHSIRLFIPQSFLN